LQYAALLEHFSLKTPWFSAALDDVTLAFPGLRVDVMRDTNGSRLQSFSTGAPNDVLSALSPYVRSPLSAGTVGAEIQKSKKHIKQITSRISDGLQKNHESTQTNQIIERSVQNAFSKTQLLATRLSLQGQLHTALDSVGPVTHRAAISSLFVGDWFLGQHAANYFAKSFIPAGHKSAEAAASAGVEPGRVCIHCWHTYRFLFLEDAAHVVFECPRYGKERADLLSRLPQEVAGRIEARQSIQDKLSCLLNTEDPSTWSEFGRFAARAWQSRRKLRTEFQRKETRL
jgi:hypothetical protein